jgi:hypothetical protein
MRYSYLWNLSSAPIGTYNLPFAEPTTVSNRVERAGSPCSAHLCHHSVRRKDHVADRHCTHDRRSLAAGPGDRLGTKNDAQDQLTLLQAASAEMKQLAQDGKCWNIAEKEFKLPGYESWPGYKENLEFIARRYCALWGRGT